MSEQHGWMACRACHKNGNTVSKEGDWHLRANPGYWGAASPKVLVLGFSKGANQISAAAMGSFDSVAFAGMRPRLENVLSELGIDLDGQTMDEALSSRGRTIGAASLVRCGLSMMKDGKLVTSGTVMPKAVKASLPLRAMRTCIDQHLNPLPDSVESVVLLGTTPAYVKGVKALMRERFNDYQDLNEIAFRAQGRTWVFASHPSPANGTFQDWVEGSADDQAGRKKLLAQKILGVRATTAPGPIPPSKPFSTTKLSPLPAALKPVRSATKSSSDDDRFAKSFHLVRNDGRKVVPWKMENTDTGHVSFRVLRHGNTKDGQIEVTDEIELLRYCESGLYQVRARPFDKSTSASFLRPLLKHRIVKSAAS